jgi:uncharacterized membrane protein YphA (DoxX/SURF4 family)
MNLSPAAPKNAPAAMKRTAFALLWLALIAQAIWMAFHHLRLGEPWGSMSYPLMYACPFLLLAITGGHVRLIAAALRLPIAIAFLDAVADRLGLLGPHGAPGVAWGDFAHFVAYTARVNSFMPSATIPSLAVLATIGETTLGLALLPGVCIPFAAMGAAALLFLFATAMIISGYSQFAYGVYLMAAGALALSTVDASLFSVDALLSWRKRNVIPQHRQPTLNERAYPDLPGASK